MSLSDESIEPTEPTVKATQTPETQQTLPAGQDSSTESEETESGNSTSSMEEFYQLYQQLVKVTLVFTGIAFISVWIFYSPNIAFNYLLGACTGVIYLRMLAKDVERLGSEKQRLSKTRFALFIGLIVIATQIQQLKVLPIFLGFLTYKATLLVYTLQTVLMPNSK